MTVFRTVGSEFSGRTRYLKNKTKQTNNIHIITPRTLLRIIVVNVPTTSEFTDVAVLPLVVRVAFAHVRRDAVAPYAGKRTHRPTMRSVR